MVAWAGRDWCCDMYEITFQTGWKKMENWCILLDRLPGMYLFSQTCERQP